MSTEQGTEQQGTEQGAERLAAGLLVEGPAVALEHEPVPAEQSVAGEPTTAYLPLDVSAAGEIGIWEMGRGTMRDTEVDEVFVVLAGDATVEFVEPAREAIVLAPGSVVRLEAGMQTIWTVREPLRKVFIER
ncbi:cupin domain-containing protein [Agromyces mediolanus]|uniref:cupin domain-containing protein n=1 Tax=Agromyces mediolanus TaxID=41986 RepID=UPI00203E33F5|nr:cupin domain-containing protein [Agromyces mediolanus]MCM3658680.1 cupin domain-containing protein [Agromyces mediolanus]